jgi:hypothetical protein
VLRCWFEADFFVPVHVVQYAHGVGLYGVSIAVVTNQEHLRACSSDDSPIWALTLRMHGEPVDLTDHFFTLWPGWSLFVTIK